MGRTDDFSQAYKVLVDQICEQAGADLKRRLGWHRFLHTRSLHLYKLGAKSGAIATVWALFDQDERHVEIAVRRAAQADNTEWLFEDERAPSTARGAGE